MGKGQSLQEMVLENWTSTHKRVKVGPSLTAHKDELDTDEQPEHET